MDMDNFSSRPHFLVSPSASADSVRSTHLLLVRTSASRIRSTLTIRLRGIITLVNNQILRSVVVLAAQVALKDSLGAVGISLLRIKRGTRHVRNHGVSTTEGVLCVAERVVLGCGLREPDVSSIAAEVAGLESLSNILLDDNGATGGVDEPRSYRLSVRPEARGSTEQTWLHLGNQFLVEQTAGLLVQGAVDGHNVTL